MSSLHPAHRAVPQPRQEVGVAGGARLAAGLVSRPGHEPGRDGDGASARLFLTHVAKVCCRPVPVWRRTPEGNSFLPAFPSCFSCIVWSPASPGQATR